MNFYNQSQVGQKLRPFKALSAFAAVGLIFMSLGNARAGQNLLTNGSFEDASSDFYVSNILEPGSKAILGWTVFQNTVVWGGGTEALGTPSDGLGFVELASALGAGGGGIAQHVATLAGHSYRLSFDLGSPNLVGILMPVTVETGPSSATKVFLFEDTNSSDGEKYQRFTFEYVAAGASDIRFSELTDYALDLDNVALTAINPAVPEPSSWAMLAAGISLIGVVARRKAIAVKSRPGRKA